MLISAKDNPKIKHYKKLCSGRKYRAEQGLFAAEGLRNVLDLIALDGIEVESVFVTEEAIEKYRGRLPVERIEQLGEGRVFRVTEAVAEKMSEVGQTQGAFAVVKAFHRELTAEAVRADGKYLVLDDLQDPGNLGTLLRTSAAVGMDGVILSNNTVDLYNPKVVRSAMASMSCVKVFVENDFSRVTDILHSVGVRTCAAVVRGGKDLRSADFSGGCAVVIGNEGRGLPDEHADMCSEKLTIHMNGSMDSLNAAIAGTIFLWEMGKR